jgi:hypothetical protein
MLELRWLIMASVFLGACSLPAGQASVDMTPQLRAQADCQRADGVWRDVLGFCEYRSGCR